MCVYILTYFIIGVIVALVNNHLYTKLQTKEQKENENPCMLVGLTVWTILWPIGIINAIYLAKEIITNKN